MRPEQWLKQSIDKPLFEDLLWSRPENKNLLGKLLIIGGSNSGFSGTVNAYSQALSASIGVVQVLLPDALKKTVGQLPFNVSFAASTNSGSFSQMALSEFLELSEWADGVLLEGEMGKNSELYILIEKYLDKYKGLLTFTDSSYEYILDNIQEVSKRVDTILVLELNNLIKITARLKLPRSISSKDSLSELVSYLAELSSTTQHYFVIKKDNVYLAAVNGQVSTTKIDKEFKNWSSTVSTHSSIWALQNRKRPFEALCCALITSSIAN